MTYIGDEMYILYTRNNCDYYSNLPKVPVSVQKCSIVPMSVLPVYRHLEVMGCILSFTHCRSSRPQARKRSSVIEVNKCHSQTRGPLGQPGQSSGSVAALEAVCCSSHYIYSHRPE